MIYFYKRLTAQQVKQFGLDESNPDIEWITVKGNHIPIQKGLSNKEKGEAIRQFFENKGERAPMQKQSNLAYAGSGQRYGAPSLSAIGSGEGAAAHGYGLYYAFNPTTARRYAKKARMLSINGKNLRAAAESALGIKFSYPPMSYFKVAYQTKIYRAFEKDPEQGKQMLVDGFRSVANVFKSYSWGGDTGQNLDKLADWLSKIDTKDIGLAAGQVIKVRLPGNKYLMREGRQIYKQSNWVQEAFKKIQEKIPGLYNGMTGKEVYGRLIKETGSKKAASELLEKYGIKGIKYNGRADGWAFVIFNPKDIDVEGHEDIYGKNLQNTSDADEDIQWITVKGNHIPIKPGQSKEDAVKSFFESKKSKGTQTSAKTSEKSEQPKPKSSSVGKTVKVNGVDRPTKNSSGAPLGKDEHAIKNFWKWFGDSKVVDNKGQPQIMYHGSLSKFDMFKEIKSGIDFTSKKEFALNYAQEKSRANEADKEPILYSVYLKAENPFDPHKKEDIKKLKDYIKDKNLSLLGHKFNQEDVESVLMGEIYEEKVLEEEKFNNTKIGETVSDKHGISIGTVIKKTDKYIITQNLLIPNDFEPDIEESTKLIKESLKDISFNKEGFAYIDIKVKGFVPSIGLTLKRKIGVKLNKVYDEKYATKSYTGNNWEILEFGKVGNKYLYEIFQELGFDGYYMQENEVKNIAVFKPNQIKIIDNNGE